MRFSRCLVIDGNCQTSVCPTINLGLLSTSALCKQITNCHFFKTYRSKGPFFLWRCSVVSSSFLYPYLSLRSPYKRANPHPYPSPYLLYDLTSQWRRRRGSYETNCVPVPLLSASFSFDSLLFK